jgi:hypothetical protein
VLIFLINKTVHAIPCYLIFCVWLSAIKLVPPVPYITLGVLKPMAANIERPPPSLNQRNGKEIKKQKPTWIKRRSKTNAYKSRSTG